jgi:hypothetical protein
MNADECAQASPPARRSRPVDGSAELVDFPSGPMLANSACVYGIDSLARMVMLNGEGVSVQPLSLGKGLSNEAIANGHFSRQRPVFRH